jgi:hypothetical protein
MKRMAYLLIVVLLVACQTCLYGATNSANSILVIFPYKNSGTWVFDDQARGLTKEPFVAGIPQMIDNLVTNIPNATNGFRLLFSAEPFPNFQTKLIWRRSEAKGNWYYSEQFKAEGWLCASLFKYFKTAPPEIYIKAEPIEEKDTPTAHPPERKADTRILNAVTNLGERERTSSPIKIGKIVFEGGDGSSVKQAVVIKNAKDEGEGIDAEQAWINKVHPGWMKGKQSLVDEKGRAYDEIEYATSKGKTKTIYFDITDFFNYEAD